LAYEAFKDNYADVIQEYAEKGISQAVWEKPKAVTNKPIVLDTKPNSMLPEQSPEQKAWIENRTKELMGEGLSLPVALMQAGQEFKSTGGAA
ncbi:hypothetical protein OKC24_19660, partial [Acinetobacter sp. BIT-DXN8]|nr:hypothetical protein [Acinetobacter entericus]